MDAYLATHLIYANSMKRIHTCINIVLCRLQFGLILDLVSKESILKR